MYCQFYVISDLFILYYYFYINLKDVCVNVVQGNAQVLDEELNLLWLGFLGMVFDMVLAFHINLIKSKCYIQHTYATFFYCFINFSNTLRVSMCSGQIVKKITIYFVYKLLILMTGLTSVALSATIMSNILKTIYMKQMQNETNLGG